MRCLYVSLAALLAIGWGATDSAVGAVTTFEQYREGSPEAAIVALFRAMYANDVPEFERLTMPHPERSRLTTGGKANEERLRSLTDNPGSRQIKLKREFQLKGQAATPDSRGWYPVGTTVRYSAAHQGSPMIVSLLRQGDGWKVDPRWWIAQTHLTGQEPPRESPDYAIKNLLLAMLHKMGARVDAIGDSTAPLDI